jgi:hypothetical protein
MILKEIGHIELKERDKEYIEHKENLVIALRKLGYHVQVDGWVHFFVEVID